MKALTVEQESSTLATYYCTYAILIVISPYIAAVFVNIYFFTNVLSYYAHCITIFGSKLP